MEFRSISKSNPFVGKNGNGRKTGSNWCSGTDGSSNNSVVKDIILNRNDSYNSTKEGPIYIIELNASDIKKIRQYNKPYDQFYINENGESELLNELNIKRLK